MSAYPDTVVATLGILCTQVVVGTAFVGLGLAIRRCWGLSTLRLEHVVVAFWVGFASTIAFLLGWHLFLPINGWAATVVLLTGFSGLAWTVGSSGRVPLPEPWLRSKWLLATVTLASTWVAFRCRGPLLNEDSELYHIQGVLWAKGYAVVPGLANLFGPLAFNNASLLFDAMLDAGFWSGRAQHVANGLIVQALVTWTILSLFRARRAAGDEQVQARFGSFLLAPAVSIALGGWLTSFATDLSSVAVQLVLLAEAHRLLLMDADTRNSEGAFSVWTIGFLGIAAVTLKLSASFIVAATLALCAASWLRHRPDRAAVVRTLAWTAAAGVGLGGLWIVTGIVLSGYPLFPAPILPLPVPWRAPLEHAQAEYAFAAHSARASTGMPEVIMGQAGWGAWLPHWWKVSLLADAYMVLVPLAIAGLCVGIILGARLRRPLRSYQAKLLALPLVFALTTWGITAPEPRYATAVAWALAALGGTSVIVALGDGSNRKEPLWASRLVLILGVSPLLFAFSPHRHPGTGGLRAMVRSQWNHLAQPGVDRALYPLPMAPPHRVVVTEGGLTLNVPDTRCLDLPVPCTPNPAPNLRLRSPGNIQDGFVVDGPWSMENWPNGTRLRFGDIWRARTHPSGEPQP